MKDSIFLPAAIAGLAITVAFALLGGVDSVLTRELLLIAVTAVAAFAAQAWTLRHHELAAGNSFGARFFTAMLSGAMTAGSHAAAAWLYLAWINPARLERLYQEYLRRAEQAAASVEQREQVLAHAEQMRDFFLDPLSQAMMQFGTALIVVLLTALLAARLARPRTS